MTVALKHIGDPVPTIDTRRVRRQPGARGDRQQTAAEEARAPLRFGQRTGDRAARGARASERCAGYRHRRRRADANAAPRRARCRRAGRRCPTGPMRATTNASATPRSAAGWIVVTARRMLIAATAGGYYLFGRPLPNSRRDALRLRDYTNMTDAQAQQAIVNAGLRVALHQEPERHGAARSRHSPKSAGRNQGRAGRAGRARRQQRKAADRPDDVRGYQRNDAQRTLQQRGLCRDASSRKFDNTAKDNVIDQRPKPGAKVQQASRVTLIVSNGPRRSTVPNFVGMRGEGARSPAHALASRSTHRSSDRGRAGRHDRIAEPHAGTHRSIKATVYASSSAAGLPNAPALRRPNGRPHRAQTSSARIRRMRSPRLRSRFPRRGAVYVQRAAKRHDRRSRRRLPAQAAARFDRRS